MVLCCWKFFRILKKCCCVATLLDIFMDLKIWRCWLAVIICVAGVAGDAGVAVNICVAGVAGRCWYCCQQGLFLWHMADFRWYMGNVAVLTVAGNACPIQALTVSNLAMYV